MKVCSSCLLMPVIPTHPLKKTLCRGCQKFRGEESSPVTILERMKVWLRPSMNCSATCQFKKIVGFAPNHKPCNPCRRPVNTGPVTKSLGVYPDAPEE